MKKLLFLLFSLLLGTLLLAQDLKDNKHKKELYFSITKHNSWYQYYSIYQGYVGASAGFGYELNNKFQLLSEYNYGFMRNNNIKTNASVHTIFIGIDYIFLHKEKLNISFFAGSGFELIYLKPLVEDINFHYTSWGFPIETQIKCSYALNNKFNIYALAKTWYSFMDISIKRSVYRQNDMRVFYYPSWFFSYGIGLSYVF